MVNCRLIEIGWEGPFTLDQVKKFNQPIDYGLYQIYGTHDLFGPGSLLYIGLACDQKFSTRLSQHEWWLGYEYSDIQIYIGRLGGLVDITMKEWEDQIKTAERLLIFYTTPPYNSQNIQGYGDIAEHTIVLNLGKKNRLPFEVSTFWEESPFWLKEKTSWNYYSE